MFSERPRRRGGMYIAVLMTALVVSIIGLSALTMTRVQLRNADADANLAEAQCCAQSAIESGVLALTKQPQWRTTNTHNSWSAATPLGAGSYQWKLVDEVNGSLTTDVSAPVRIFGSGTTAGTQRILSVLIADTTPGLPNLLQNPGFENGTSNWSSAYSCTLSTSTSTKYAGSASLLITSRSVWYSGAEQSIAASLKDGVVYEVQAWIRPRVSNVNIRFIMHLNCTTNGDLWAYAEGGSTTLGQWTLLKGELLSDWNGTLNSATLLICTDGSTNDFYVDDALIREKRLKSEFAIIPGTWRWEVSQAAALEPPAGPILPNGDKVSADEETAK